MTSRLLLSAALLCLLACYAEGSAAKSRAETETESAPTLPDIAKIVAGFATTGEASSVSTGIKGSNTDFTESAPDTDLDKHVWGHREYKQLSEDEVRDMQQRYWGLSRANEAGHGAEDQFPPDDIEVKASNTTAGHETYKQLVHSVQKAKAQFEKNPPKYRPILQPPIDPNDSDGWGVHMHKGGLGTPKGPWHGGPAKLNCDRNCQDRCRKGCSDGHDSACMSKCFLNCFQKCFT